MVYKKIWLFAGAIFFLVVFFTNDFYNNWLEKKVLNSFGFSEEASDWDLFAFQVKHLDIEERRAVRWGGTYSFCQNLKAYLDTMHVKDALVLLPPNEYAKANKVENVILPEPIVLYLECGLKGAWTTSANVNQCNWATVSDGQGGLAPVRIQTKEQLDAIIAEFNKYKY